MKHDQQEFNRRLDALLTEFVCNLTIENGRVKFDFADDPRLDPVEPAPQPPPTFPKRGQAVRDWANGQRSP